MCTEERTDRGALEQRVAWTVDTLKVLMDQYEQLQCAGAKRCPEGPSAGGPGGPSCPGAAQTQGLVGWRHLCSLFRFSCDFVRLHSLHGGLKGVPRSGAGTPSPAHCPAPWREQAPFSHQRKPSAVEGGGERAQRCWREGLRPLQSPIVDRGSTSMFNDNSRAIKRRSTLLAGLPPPLTPDRPAPALDSQRRSGTTAGGAPAGFKCSSK